MKLFPNQRIAIENIIQKTLQGNQSLDAIIQNTLKENKKWGSRDRRHIAQASYDIIRYYYILKALSSHSSSLIDTYLNYLSDDNLLDIKVIIENHPELHDSDRYSVSPEVYLLYQKENPNAEENLKTFLHPAHIYLRENISLCEDDTLSNALLQADIKYDKIDTVDLEHVSYPIHAIEVYENTNKHRNVYESISKCYEIQDIGSQLLTEWINFDQVDTIIEGCAGNGGKTAHICDSLSPEFPLHICFDNKIKKLEHLQNRIAKWSGHKVVTEKSNPKNISKYETMADLLLLDVPCTGSGTLKRQSDIKFKLDQKYLDLKLKQQRDIIDSFHPVLKSGGRLIYTTCSLFQSENQGHFEYITSLGFKLLDSKTLEPCQYEGDGFFYAEFEKL